MLSASRNEALIGKFACRFCRHDQYKHNFTVGCPFCRCMATPGEAAAQTDRELDYSILPETQVLDRYAVPAPSPPGTVSPPAAVMWVAGKTNFGDGEDEYILVEEIRSDDDPAARLAYWRRNVNSKLTDLHVVRVSTVHIRLPEPQES